VERLISGQRTNIVFAVLFLGLLTVENYPFFSLYPCWSWTITRLVLDYNKVGSGL
jgi:hypothetical protein